MSEHEYWNAVRLLVEDAHAAERPKQDVSDEIVRLVEQAVDAGDPWARAILTRWMDTGAKDDYTKVFKAMNTITYIRSNGKRVRKTTGYSRPRRSKATGEIIGYQLQAYWGMSRMAIVELRREMFALGETIDDNVAALDQIITAMNRHPECRTAQDAWEADGRDIGEIDLGFAA